MSPATTGAAGVALLYLALQDELLSARFKRGMALGPERVAGPARAALHRSTAPPPPLAGATAVVGRVAGRPGWQGMLQARWGTGRAAGA